MSNFIQRKSLSVGYNMDGQDFFDTILPYEEYIHSYFFSLTDSIGCNTLDISTVAETLSNSCTYGIPANLLLNTKKAEDIWEYLLDISMKIVNLTAVTVLTPQLAEVIKKKYPHLDIHLSVRFWDYHPDIPCDKLLEDNMGFITRNMSVVNLSDVRSFNDFALADKIRLLGCKTKFIVNEGCVINRTDNYSRFPGFEEEGCTGAPCGINCYRLTQEYPWMILGRALFYKEFIPIWPHQYDILKLSTRHTSSYEIGKLLQYWTSNEDTEYINCNGVILYINNRDEYIKWIMSRATCKGNCWECRKCETAFKLIDRRI